MSASGPLSSAAATCPVYLMPPEAYLPFLVPFTGGSGAFCGGACSDVFQWCAPSLHALSHVKLAARACSVFRYLAVRSLISSCRCQSSWLLVVGTRSTNWVAGETGKECRTPSERIMSHTAESQHCPSRTGCG